MVEKLIVGVDLGGTQSRTALADARGKIIQRVSQPTMADEGPEAALERIKGAIRRVLSAEMGKVGAIGFAAPGPLDPWKGVIIDAVSLPGWRNTPLRDLMEEEFGLPVVVGNDANLAALAEQRFGAGQGVSDLIFILCPPLSVMMWVFWVPSRWCCCHRILARGGREIPV